MLMWQVDDSSSYHVRISERSNKHLIEVRWRLRKKIRMRIEEVERGQGDGVAEDGGKKRKTRLIY